MVRPGVGRGARIGGARGTDGGAWEGTSRVYVLAPCACVITASSRRRAVTGRDSPEGPAGPYLHTGHGIEAGLFTAPRTYGSTR